jgi:hypothetical protein
MTFGCKFLFETHTLLEQCTYLGYLLLEAPREYVQHGPLLSINWLRLCPQSGARIRSHAVRRRLFIVLMTAAHISPNVFSLRTSSQHTRTILHYTLILIIHHIQASNFFSIKLFIHILIYNTDHPRAEDRNGGLFASATPPLATRIEFICLFLFKTITLSNA